MKCVFGDRNNLEKKSETPCTNFFSAFHPPWPVFSFRFCCIFQALGHNVSGIISQSLDLIDNASDCISHKLTYGVALGSRCSWFLSSVFLPSVHFVFAHLKSTQRPLQALQKLHHSHDKKRPIVTPQVTHEVTKSPLNAPPI